MPSTSVWIGRRPSRRHATKSWTDSWIVSISSVGGSTSWTVSPPRGLWKSARPSLHRLPASPTTENRSVEPAGSYAQLVVIVPTDPSAKRTTTWAESSPSMNVSRCLLSIAVTSAGSLSIRWRSR